MHLGVAIARYYECTNLLLIFCNANLINFGKKTKFLICICTLQQLAPTWDKLGNLYESDPLVSIGKLDCTQAQNTCKEHGVSGYPTLQYFRDGEKVADFRGSRLIHWFFKDYCAYFVSITVKKIFF